MALDPNAQTTSITDLDDDALAARLGLGGESTDDFTEDGEEGEAPEASGDEGAESEEELAAPDGDASTATDGSEEAEEEEAEGDTEVAPEAAAADKPVASEPRALAAKFTVADAEGALDPHSVADLEVTLSLGGKERKLTFDKVVRLATAGIHNEELEARADRADQLARDLEATRTSAQEFERAVLAKVEELLDDPEKYDTAREKHLARNTPEERARRAEERLQRLEQERIEQARVTAGEQFLTGELGPAIESLVNQTGGAVSVEEVMGRLHHLIDPLKDRSNRIPVEAFKRVMHVVANDLTPWVEARAASRMADTDRVTKEAAAKAAAKVKRAAEAATIAKRRFVRPLKPKGAGVGKGAAAAGAKRGADQPARNADEANERIISKLFA